MPKRMLIDASHPEETRVVVLDGNKVEEFDFEAASKRPLKGNIYLAKVTRVEPSLQAAFVEYGGNRQGFLAFSEIHPDYYQIPVADRMAILQAQTQRMMAEGRCRIARCASSRRFIRARRRSRTSRTFRRCVPDHVHAAAIIVHGEATGERGCRSRRAIGSEPKTGIERNPTARRRQDRPH